jgi:deazaflavin-dependent oxidoreductase (nitroreductase family)
MNRQWDERNRNLIDQFRLNGGLDPERPRPLLLLTTVGARSGRAHTTPLMYLSDAGRLVVLASKGGLPGHPDWYHNLVANPRVNVEVGTAKFETDAVIAEGEERELLFARQAELYPIFAEYQAAMERVIPVVILPRQK